VEVARLYQGPKGGQAWHEGWQDGWVGRVLWSRPDWGKVQDCWEVLPCYQSRSTQQGGTV
jgi:hypothetical protein